MISFSRFADILGSISCQDRSDLVLIEWYLHRVFQSIAFGVIIVISVNDRYHYRRLHLSLHRNLLSIARLVRRLRHRRHQPQQTSLPPPPQPPPAAASTAAVPERRVHGLLERQSQARQLSRLRPALERPVAGHRHHVQLRRVRCHGLLLRPPRLPEMRRSGARLSDRRPVACRPELQRLLSLDRLSEMPHGSLSCRQVAALRVQHHPTAVQLNVNCGRSDDK